MGVSKYRNTSVATPPSLFIAGASSREGITVIGSVAGEIASISEAVEQAGTSMDRLVSAARDIDRIVVVIGEVADQTNLLALNAAI
jgi:methyl-accepting chemotaxis protein